MNWCTKYEGKSIWPQQFWRDVLIALHYAWEINYEVFNTAGQLMTLDVADDIYAKLWDPEDEVHENPFTVPDDKKYWALRIQGNWFPMLGELTEFGFNIPLVNLHLKEAFQMLVAPVDIYIPGSEFWFYRTPDGFKQGTDEYFDTPRQVGVFGDILANGKYLLYTYLIAKACKTLGITTFVGAFLLKMRGRTYNVDIDEVNGEKVDELLINDDAQDVVLADIVETLALNGIKLNDIKSKIGLKLKLR